MIPRESIVCIIGPLDRAVSTGIGSGMNAKTKDDHREPGAP
jgi:hypothetical protein